MYAYRIQFKLVQTMCQNAGYISFITFFISLLLSSFAHYSNMVRTVGESQSEIFLQLIPYRVIFKSHALSLYEVILYYRQGNRLFNDFYLISLFIIASYHHLSQGTLKSACGANSGFHQNRNSETVLWSVCFLEEQEFEE